MKKKGFLLAEHGKGATVMTSLKATPDQPEQLNPAKVLSPAPGLGPC